MAGIEQGSCRVEKNKAGLWGLNVWDRRIPGDRGCRTQSKAALEPLHLLQMALTFPESSQEPRGCPGSVLSHPASSQSLI